MHIHRRFLTTAAAAATLLCVVGANAATDPKGVWIDHTGRGAVEITDCNGALCGRVVWLKDTENAEACGIQILGDVKPVGAGVWDKGWIYDPEQDARFSVELKPIGEEKLQVTGYLGTKLLSETMTWTRAPADLQRCAGDIGTTAALSPNEDAGTPAAAGTAISPSNGTAASPEGNKSKVESKTGAETKSAAADGKTVPRSSTASKTEPKSDQPARSASKPQECAIRTPWVSFSFPCPD